MSSLFKIFFKKLVQFIQNFCKISFLSFFLLSPILRISLNILSIFCKFFRNNFSYFTDLFCNLYTTLLNILYPSIKLSRNFCGIFQKFSKIMFKMSPKFLQNVKKKKSGGLCRCTQPLVFNVKCLCQWVENAGFQHSMQRLSPTTPSGSNTKTSFTLSRLQMIHKTSVRWEKHARRKTCIPVISYFLCCFTRQISRVLCLDPSHGRSGYYARDKAIF